MGIKGLQQRVFIIGTPLSDAIRRGFIYKRTFKHAGGYFNVQRNNVGKSDAT